MDENTDLLFFAIFLVDAAREPLVMAFIVTGVMSVGARGVVPVV